MKNNVAILRITFKEIEQMIGFDSDHQVVGFFQSFYEFNEFKRDVLHLKIKGPDLPEVEEGAMMEVLNTSDIWRLKEK